MSSNDRMVYRDGDGDWVNKRKGAERVAGRHDTQAAAEQEAREMLQRSGGGELTTWGQDGKIRSKDTIGGNDSCPPRDTEH
jgi:hypothetical protein